jgi:hypothetical protein
MLRDMQYALVTNNSHVQGGIWFKPVLKEYLETKKIDVEFSRLGFVKATQNRDRMFGVHIGILANAVAFVNSVPDAVDGSSTGIAMCQSCGVLENR